MTYSLRLNSFKSPTTYFGLASNFSDKKTSVEKHTKKTKESEQLGDMAIYLVLYNASRLTRGQEVGSSNLPIPTQNPAFFWWGFYFMRKRSGVFIDELSTSLTLWFRGFVQNEKRFYHRAFHKVHRENKMDLRISINEC